MTYLLQNWAPLRLWITDSKPLITYNDSSPGICSYTIQRQWTATDSAGNSVSKIQFISIVDNSPPSWSINDPSSVVPSPVTISRCVTLVPIVFSNDQGQITDLNVNDTCSGIGSISYSDDVSEMIGNDGCITGQFIRKWIVSDECSNSFSYKQSFDVVYIPTAGASINSLCSMFLVAMITWIFLLY